MSDDCTTPMTTTPLGHFYGPLAELIPARGDEQLHIRKNLPDVLDMPQWFQKFYKLVDYLNEDIRNGTPFPNPPQPPQPLTAMKEEDAARVMSSIIELETGGEVQFQPEYSINLNEGRNHG